MSLSEPFHIKSFIWKRGAFAGDKVRLHKGLSNHCTHCKGNKFILYLDCDFPRIYIYDGICLLRKKFKELAKAKFLLVQSSKNHYFLASFVRLTWQRYLDMLWYAVEIGLEHKGHAQYTTGKGYAVLRTGAKKGVVPKIVCSIGSKPSSIKDRRGNVVCKKCMKEFTESFEQWQKESVSTKS